MPLQKMAIYIFEAFSDVFKFQDLMMDLDHFLVWKIKNE